MLGRVSSLDFFVSLALMPVSMALAGPVGERIGLAPAFLVAGTVPTLLAVITVFAARMPRRDRAPARRELHRPDASSHRDADQAGTSLATTQPGRVMPVHHCGGAGPGDQQATPELPVGVGE